MAINTTNYAIPKPELNDIADVEVLNTGLDIIDNQMKVNADGIVSGDATLQANINLKADQTALDATNATVATKANQTALDATNATVALKADQATTYTKTESDNKYVPKGIWENATIHPNPGKFTIWSFARPVQYKIEGNHIYFRGEFAWTYSLLDPPFEQQISIFATSIGITTDLNCVIGSFDSNSRAGAVSFTGRFVNGTMYFDFFRNTYGVENTPRRLVFDGLVLSLD